MDENTPRRSSRVSGRKEANPGNVGVEPVSSFKTNWEFKWPHSPLTLNDVEDLDEAVSFLVGGKHTSNFYGSIIMYSSESSPRKEFKFKLGDAVLVRTPGTNNPSPSVAIIVSMWQQQASSSESSSSRALDEEDMVPRIRVHWFVKPSELPPVRSSRHHEANEIYYSTSSSDVLLAESILAKVSVSSAKAAVQQLPDGRSFCCFYATDPTMRNFYPFEMEKMRQRAYGHISPRTWDFNPFDDTKKSPRKLPPSSSSSSLTTPNKRRRVSLYTTEEESSDAEEHESEPPDDDDAVTVTPSKSERRRRVGRQIDHSHSQLQREIDPIPSASDPCTPSKPRKTDRGAVSHLLKADTLQIKISPVKATTTTLDSPSSSTSPSKGKLDRRPSSSKKKKKNDNNNNKRRIADLVVPDEFASFANESDDLSGVAENPFLRAMHVLHVASRPDVLPCRDEEYTEILGKVLTLLEEGAGGCIYISGVPGTGKTATVHAVIRELKRMAEVDEASPFTYVEVNGLKIPEPSAAYGLLWEALSGRDIAEEGRLRISPKEALRKLDRYFSGDTVRGPGSHACIVMMDELDQLLTTKQDVVYNFFNWPTMGQSKLIVLAVANTMDLPTRVMTGRVRSRMGMERVDFRPYDRSQLTEIVTCRLRAASSSLGMEAEDLIVPDAIKLAAMKVSGISGDARRVLDLCRKAVEVHYTQKRSGPVTTRELAGVLSQMQNSPTRAYVEQCGFQERVMLASLWKCMKKEGVSFIKWDEVSYSHQNFSSVLTTDAGLQYKLTATELEMVLDSLAAAHAILIENPRKGLANGERKVMLNLEEMEVLKALGEIGGEHWRRFLGL